MMMMMMMILFYGRRVTWLGHVILNVSFWSKGRWGVTPRHLYTGSIKIGKICGQICGHGAFT